jgi:CRP/FNR family cyclic AMP-dependent transcriptional regulator
MEHAKLLAGIALFDDLKAAELDELAARLNERKLEAGAVVFAAGDPGDALFIIAEGSVEITTGEGRVKTALTTLFPGQIFGELSVFDGAPRSATATTTKPTTVLTLGKDEFHTFLMAHPSATLTIMGELAERIRATNDLFSSQVSRDVLEEADEKLTFGQRIADAVAAFGGSWTFIGVFCGMMAIWMGTNFILGDTEAFDPFPFILLNLMLSTTAALQAPVIMMSQNRQSTKDKLLAQNDYLVNLKAELGIQQLLKNQAEMLQRLNFIERAGGKVDGGEQR